MLEAVWVHFRSRLELILGAVRRVFFVPISEQHLPRPWLAEKAESPEPCPKPPPRIIGYIYIYIYIYTSVNPCISMHGAECNRARCY